MKDKIIDIIAKQLDIEVTEISDTTFIVEDLGADSLDIIEILSETTFASAMAASWTNSMWLFSLAAFRAATAARRETVKMVPSAGFITALYAASTPDCSASAHSTPIDNSIKM